MDYLYDGTFDGFLCCVYAHYYQEKASGIYWEKEYQRNFLTLSCCVETDIKKADKVTAAIQNKISSFCLRRVFYVFQCSDPEKETSLLQYLRLGFRLGAAVDSLHGNPIVYRVQQMEKKVTNEIHRLEGLVRFTVVQNGVGEVLYAPLTPDHDVCCLLVDHFSDRLGKQPFVLHDKGRKKAVFCYGGQWREAPLSPDIPISLSDSEKEYRRLWKEYFNHIAIKERKNSRCQRNFMPVRYWQHLTEMKE